MCKYCQRRHKDYRCMIYHLRYECGRKFVCVCGVESTKKGYMVKHIRTKHSDNVDSFMSAFTCRMVVHPITARNQRQ